MGIRSRKNLKMTKCLALKHIDFIKLLASYREKSKQFKSLIKCASTEELNAISEVVLNILRGILPFETSKKQKFAKHAKYLRFIGNPQKKFCNQKKKGADFKREGDRGTTFKCRNTTVNGYFFKKVKKHHNVN